MDPKVSVVIAAYNQENLIRQAVQSALDQETDFDFEILVGDDCSTDSTRAVVEELMEERPGIIRLFTASSNMGAQRNFMRLIDECKGEYIAHLDGDDYWTSPRKLAKQVAYMDAEPGCAICYHNVFVIYVDRPGAQPVPSQTPFRGVSTIDDLLQRNYIYSCSMMFRRSAFPGFPDWYAEESIGDYPLLILVAKNGWIGHIDEVLAAYRVHAVSTWALRSHAEQIRITVDVLQAVGAELSHLQRQMLAASCAAMLRNAAGQLESQGDSDTANAFRLRANDLLAAAGVG